LAVYIVVSVATESSPCSSMLPVGFFGELPDKLFTDFLLHIIIFRGMYDSSLRTFSSKSLHSWY